MENPLLQRGGFGVDATLHIAAEVFIALDLGVPSWQSRVYPRRTKTASTTRPDVRGRLPVGGRTATYPQDVYSHKAEDGGLGLMPEHPSK
jgi:hypothetical protein